jgi:hypothetical protein
VLMFKWINERSIIDFILKLAGFTYGPLLGLFAFGILTKRTLDAYWIPTICIGALMITFYLDFFNNPAWYQTKFKITGTAIENLKTISDNFFGGYKIGVELLLINGIITFLGLLAISKKK